MKYSIKDLERDLFRRNGKYPLMGFMIALIHFIYIVMFSRLEIFPLVVYNIVIVICYSYFGIVCYTGEKIKAFFVFLCIEIPLHAVLCSILIGWNYRFMLFMFGMIPIVFFTAVFIEEISHKVLFPSVLGIFYAFLYVVVRLALENIKPFYSSKLISEYEHFFLYFNTILTFGMLLYFSILFSFEFNYIQNKMISENKSLGTHASYDTLTGLMNRRSIDSYLDSIFKENYHDNESFSIIMCDIDHFKAVNDTYGHDAGDYILKEVSAVIRNEVRDNDVVSRWGGEEFLLVLKADKIAATKLAERIRASIEKHVFTYKNQTLNITMTLGVSSYHNGNDISSLVRSADKKLYRGKENGRNQVVS